MPALCLHRPKLLREAHASGNLRSCLLNASGSNSFCERPLEDQEENDARQDAKQSGCALRGDIHSILSLVDGQGQRYGHVRI